MDAHITASERGKIIDEKIKQLMEAGRQQGIKIGVVSVSTVIKNKAEKATPETAMQVIADIIDFCERPLTYKETKDIQITPKETKREE